MVEPTIDQDVDETGPASMVQSEPAEKGLCIEIKCMPGGKFSVSMEPLADEAAEEQGGEAEEPRGEVVASFGDALKKALDLYKQNPVSQAPDDQFNAGFGANPMPQRQVPK